MCKYCKAELKNLEMYDDGGLSLSISENVLDINYYGNLEGWTNEEMKINYCPMCGRKLGD